LLLWDLQPVVIDMCAAFSQLGFVNHCRIEVNVTLWRRRQHSRARQGSPSPGWPPAQSLRAILA
jgi:hypothetical protein